MEYALTVVFALIGTAVGSFLNVCIDRLPIDKSIVFPPSHCEACEHRLSVKDLIPVFSYLWLRGRCGHCGISIPRRLFWVEVSSGLIFAFTCWHYGLSVEFAVITFYLCLFLVLGIIDLEHGLILNKITYPAAVVALIISILLPSIGSTNISLPWPDVANGAIGGTAGFVLLLMPALIFRGGMGWGDVKMAALIGLVTGFPLVALALLMGVILGALVGGGLLLLKIKGHKEAIPFGPFLSLATVVTLVWGSDILDWYLRIF